MSFGFASGQFGAIALSTTGGDGHVAYFAVCCASEARRPAASLPQPAGGAGNGGRCVPAGPGVQKPGGGGPSSPGLASTTTVPSRVGASDAASGRGATSRIERSDDTSTSAAPSIELGGVESDASGSPVPLSGCKTSPELDTSSPGPRSTRASIGIAPPVPCVFGSGESAPQAPSTTAKASPTRPFEVKFLKKLIADTRIEELVGGSNFCDQEIEDRTLAAP